MLVIPSVDIMDGQCVQLVGGKPDTKRVYGGPVEWAKKWEEAGAEIIHLVDLDAALGNKRNDEKLKEVFQSVNVVTQVGGGIRDITRAEALLKAGAGRIVVGTAAVENPNFVVDLVESFGGDRIIVALDSRGGKVAVEGWKKTSVVSTVDLAKSLEKIGIWGFLFTSVDVEGSMRGPDVDAIKTLVNTVSLPVMASGGIGSLDDIEKVVKTGAYGLVLGMALYERKFTLQQAKEVANG